MGCISVQTKRIGKGINIHSQRIGNGIKVSCGLVCSVTKANYLRVSPEYIFLMPGNNFSDDVLVTSNIVWNVN